MDGTNRNFRVNFSDDGAGKLRERVMDKLKEFMGDYTDDTLVEYVIVLLRNGRYKEEARNELNVFLGDDTDSFVSWLWDHLSTNLHQYVQQEESYPELRSTLGQQASRSDFHRLDSVSEREKATNESKKRRNREWKELVRDEDEPPALRSSEIEHLHSEEKILQRPIRRKRSLSPLPPIQNKKSRQDERQHTKREPLSHPTVGASRRLLQFAVRDAVGALRQSSSRTDPTLKRLRSVVSTSTLDSSLYDQPQIVRSVAILPSAVGTVSKTAAEAAADVARARCSANVFDRLGHGMDVSGMTNQSVEFKGFKGTTREDAGYGDFDQIAVDTHSNYLETNEYSGEFGGNSTMLDRDTGTAYDSASDNDMYDGVSAMRHRVLDASETGTSYGHKDDDSLMVQYSVANNTNEVVKRTRVKDQNPPPTVASTSRKIVNISVNVNTWKPPHYQAPQEVREGENLKAVQESDAGASRSVVRVMKEENNSVNAVNEDEKSGAVMQKDSQKTIPSVPSSYSTGRPSEDVDTRTIFINNVHFAATKDSLSRHFNKFGEVLKVVILTDAATGQPKGSAYIEFMRKEAAELALSLSGTSFMSRILKVVKKSSAHQQETCNNMMTRPPRARAFPRGGVPFRSRLAIKPGARSMQWKRDGAAPSNEVSVNAQNGASVSVNNVSSSPSARSLTYVRNKGTPA